MKSSRSFHCPCLLLLACLVCGQVALEGEVVTTNLEAQNIGLANTPRLKAFSTRFEGTEGPLRASHNPNYFADSKGSPLILCGSQTWNTLQEIGRAHV